MMSIRLVARAAGLCALLTCISIGGIGIAQEGNGSAYAARLSAAKELMKVTGAVRQFDTVMPVLFQQMRERLIQEHPGQEKELTEILSAIAMKFDTRKHELIDEVAALHARRLSLQEVKDLIAFYRSAIGRKYIRLQPEILEQSIIAGQRWGEKIGREIEEEVRTLAKQRGLPI